MNKKEDKSLEQHNHDKPQEEKKELPKPQATVDAVKHYVDCPDCHKKINEIAKKEVFPEIEKWVNQVNRDKVKSLKEPVICKDCGEIVGKSEPKCTNCGSTEARKF